MGWLSWWEMLMLGAVAACVCVTIVGVLTLTAPPDNRVTLGASKTLGVIGSILVLMISAMIIWGLVGEGWPAVLGYLGVAGGLTGIVGIELLRHNRKAAGILMLAAGMLSHVTVAGSALLTTGGVLLSGKPQRLTGKRAVFKMLQMVSQLMFAVLALANIVFDAGLVIAITACAFGIAVLIFAVLNIAATGNAPEQRPVTPYR